MLRLSAVAAKASHDFDLPRDVTLRMTSCGSPDAWYNAISGELTLCYERLSYFRELARQAPAGLFEADAQACCTFLNERG